MDKGSSLKVSITLPPQAITEFCEIYKKEFGVVLESGEALEKANRVLDLFRMLGQTERRRT